MTKRKILPSSVVPTSPLWVTGRALLARRGIDFFSHWNWTRDTLDMENINDLRVVSRRFRECLLLFGPCFRQEDLSHILRKLKQLTRRLVILRNIHESLVFMEQLTGELSSTADKKRSPLQEYLRQESKRQARQLDRLLGKVQKQTLSTRFWEFCYSPTLFGQSGLDPFMPAHRYVRETVYLSLGETSAMAAAARNESDLDAQKRWRTTVKKLRYRLEVVTPVVTTPLEDELELLGSYRDLLEELHDLDRHRDLVEAWIKDIPSAKELTEIIATKRSGAWRRLETLMKELPWERLVKKIGDSL